MDKKKVKTIGLASAAVLAIPLLWWGYCEAGFHMTYSRGTRTGVVQKFSEKGVIWKTFEGQLNQGTFLTDPKTGQVHGWEFSVLDPAVADKVRQAEKDHKPVTLYYRQVLRHLWYKGDTDYFITNVE